MLYIFIQGPVDLSNGYDMKRMVHVLQITGNLNCIIEEYCNYVAVHIKVYAFTIFLPTFIEVLSVLHRGLFALQH